VKLDLRVVQLLQPLLVTLLDGQERLQHDRNALIDTHARLLSSITPAAP
jgi:hypothetical protein